MLKYIAVTVVALFGIGLTIGDESRRQEVSRASGDAFTGLSFANFAASSNVEVETLETPRSDISEAEAVATALEAAKTHRAAQEVRITLRGMTAPEPVVTNAVVTETVSTEPDIEMWYVTGSRVNIRSGPSTSNGIVTQAVFGDEAEPLTSTASDWIEIRMSDGTTGWIFSKFLDDNLPG